MSKPHQQTYIYERVNNTVYARQVGSTDRVPISQSDPGYQQLLTWDVWQDICELANDNDVIRQQLDRLLICYRLIKK